MNPYRRFVNEIARLTTEVHALAGGDPTPAPQPRLARDAPAVLVFAPHPDDECITGALPLRLLRQAKMRVVDVAVTQGSSRPRQAGRLAELKKACDFLGFDLVTTRPGGLERITVKTRSEDRAHWQACVEVIVGILVARKPRIVFVPHDADWNGTHIGTHHLVVDALSALGREFEGHVVETEYWQALAQPNLMVESSEEDVADLVAATALHVGEVQRNPYHVRLPAWMQDNVRRGGELVGGQGRPAPQWTFGTLYRVRRWRQGTLEDAFAGGRLLSRQHDPASVFADLVA